MSTADAPRRIQRQRAKGWRAPERAIYVGRPSRWGNPFSVDGGWITWAAVAAGYTGNADGRRAAALAFHRAWLLREPVTLGPLANDDTGGAIEFTSGRIVTMGEAARSIAAGVANDVYTAPALSEPPDRASIVASLRGRDLLCWCPLTVACHADVLLEIANGPDALLAALAAEAQP